MRLRRALWHALGPALGRVAPGVFTAYYGAVTRSLTQALARESAVRSVYAYGSYADGVHRPGVSDVDLLVVLEDGGVEEELAALRRLRPHYRRRQAVLPVDVTPLLASELPRVAPWLSSVRARIGDGAPLTPPTDWRLLAGDDVRPSNLSTPDPRLAHLTDAHVAQAISAYARERDGRAVGALGRRLGQLVRDLDREQLRSGSAERLREAHRLTATAGASKEAAAGALGAALELIEEQRRRMAVPLVGPPAVAGWVAQGPAADAAERVAAVLPHGAFRSATLLRPAGAGSDVLLLETAEGRTREAALQALDLAQVLVGDRVDVQLLTSGIAEDGWRTLMRTGPLLVAGVHLGGEPLAPRISFPSQPWLRAVALQRALGLVAHARRSLIGWREGRAQAAALPALELWAQVSSRGLLDFRLVPGEQEPSRGSHERLLRRWRSWLADAELVDEENPFSPHALTVE